MEKWATKVAAAANQLDVAPEDTNVEAAQYNNQSAGARGYTVNQTIIWSIDCTRLRTRRMIAILLLLIFRCFDYHNSNEGSTNRLY